MEKSTSVEQSMIWSLLEAFQAQHDSDTGSEETGPPGRRANCQIADIHAAIVSEFLRELRRHGNTTRPLIIELGGGNGRFAWYFLQRLLRYRWKEEDGDPCFTYLLTDASAGNIRRWREQPRMQALSERGFLDFGHFRLDDNPEIITDTGRIVPAELADRPVILIAHYLFSSVPSDLYRKRGKNLERMLLSLETDDEQLAAGQPASFAAVKPHYDAVPLARSETGLPLLDSIIDRYTEHERDFAIPVPRIAFGFLEQFTPRAAPMLMLASDLAYSNPSGFSDRPPLVFDTYFAQYANFHAFAELFRHHGGDAQFQRFADKRYCSGAFWLPGTGAAAANSLTSTRAAAREHLEEFNPHDIHELLQLLEDSAEDPSYRQIGAWLRLARFDPDVTRAGIGRLIETIHRYTEGLDRQQVHDMVMESWRMYLPDGDTTTLDYVIAQLFLAMHYDGQAIGLLEESIREFGRKPERIYVYALALLRVDRREEARAMLDEVLRQRPDFVAATRVLEENFRPRPVEQRIAAESSELAHLTFSCRAADCVERSLPVFQDTGVLWLKDMFPRSYIEDVRTAFMKSYRAWKQDEMGKPNFVGNKRYTVPLRMQAPFNEPELFGNRVLMDIMTRVMGQRPIICAYGGVVTYPGANSQHVHREHPLLFTEDRQNLGLPPHAFNVLIPLMDLDESLGGTQVWESTQTLGSPEQVEGPSKIIYAQKGDAVVLDYRVFHGGMPCRAEQIRPVLFISYSFPWFRDTLAFQAHDALAVSPSELEAIPEDFRDMFRFARKIQERAA
jgi:tetratricopeptide (TPR) repeat protein